MTAEEAARVMLDTLELLDAKWLHGRPHAIDCMHPPTCGVAALKRGLEAGRAWDGGTVDER